MTAAVSASLACADEVWCSTPDLARRIATLGCRHIQVLPNALDPEMWQTDRPPLNVTRRHASPMRMLYMGTRTHDQDFAFLHSVMERLHREAPGAFELFLIGVRSRDVVMPPWLHLLSPPGHVGASYPAFVHWFVQQHGLDLGLAPLMGNPFNDCKSPIKVFDYAAIGLPALASDMPAYTHSLTSGIDCFHAVNEAQAWCTAIRELGGRPEARERVRRAARSLVDPAVFRCATADRLARLIALREQA